MRKFFRSKKLVYSIRLAPAELVKYFRFGGKKYVRIAFTNKVKFKGTTPVTDIRFTDVTGIKKLPSPFKKMLYKSFGLRARPTFYKIAHK